MAMLELMDTPSKRTPHQTSGQSWPSALSSRSVTETSCGWCTTSSDALAVDHVTLRWPIAQFTPYAALAPGSPADGRGTQPDPQPLLVYPGCTSEYGRSVMARMVAD